MALLVAVDHLLCREHGLCLRVPVDHTQATVDKALLVEVYKHLEHALWALLVHGEGCAVPIAWGTQTAELLEDDASVLVGPVPRMLKKLLACQVALLDALLSQTVHHLCLCSDWSVVGSRHPACVHAFHSCPAHEDVLNCVVEHVSHVQHTRHVWWRNDHGVGFASIGLATEHLVVKPILIPFRLHCLWVVFAC